MHYDYFMRQVQILSNVVNYHTGREAHTIEVTDPYRNEASNKLYKRLMEMLADGKINEAENLLFNVIERGEISKQEALNLAFDFYLKINSYTDDYLSLCNFSRAEANMGWAEITKLCQM